METKNTRFHFRKVERWKAFGLTKVSVFLHLPLGRRWMLKQLDYLISSSWILIIISIMIPGYLPLNSSGSPHCHRSKILFVSGQRSPHPQIRSKFYSKLIQHLFKYSTKTLNQQIWPAHISSSRRGKGDSNVKMTKYSLCRISLKKRNKNHIFLNTLFWLKRAWKVQ